MFTFNLTMEQLLAIRKDCADILATVDPDEGLAFNAKHLYFFPYMEGWEYDDVDVTDLIIHTRDVNSVIGEIVSRVGEEIPETEEESQAKWDALETRYVIKQLWEEKAELTISGKTSWDNNKIGSFLSAHSPFYVRPYEGDKMEIVDSNGNWLLRTSKVLKGGNYEDYMNFKTESGHEYPLVPFTR